MSRSSSSFRRSGPRYKPQPTVLVVCEDSKSSLNYLNEAKGALRVIADIEIVHSGKTNPLGVVQYAVEQSSKYNIVYCVVDRDTHADFDRAVELAKKHGKIEMIISYPCFEYWLLLHFKYSRKAYASTGKKSPGEQMERALKECEGMKDYDKGGNVNLYDRLKGEPLKNACKNAERSLIAAVDENEFNPSTTLHILLNEFSRLSKPEAL
jgi:hypothetical protein